MLYVYLASVFNWLPHVPGLLDFVILIGATVAALELLRKTVWLPMMRVFRKFNRAADSMLGYDEVLDPGTGRVIQQATPAMADRVKDLEDAHITIAEALQSIAVTQEQMLTVSKNVVELSERFDAHEQAAHEWAQQHEDWSRNWMDEHSTLHALVDHSSVKPPTDQS